MNKIPAFVFLLVSLALFLAAIAAFVLLFVRNFTLYWLILSPVIFAVYQIPAVLFFWFYKKRKKSGFEAPDDHPPS